MIINNSTRLCGWLANVHSIKMSDWTVTLTFAESVENHIGNEQIGSKFPRGPSTVDLQHTLHNMQRMYGNRININGHILELSKMHGVPSLDASVLIIKGLNAHSNDDAMALKNACWDSKYFDTRRSVVLNKNARHNLCFTDQNQEPNYEIGQGRTYAFNNCAPFMPKLREFFSNTLIVGGHPYLQLNGGKPLYAEGNYYYDHRTTYIGWHGDVERSIVVGYRIGVSFPLHFMLFSECKPHHETLTTIDLEDGDAYIMSHDATGQDWKKHAPAYRHSAGHVGVLNKTQNHKI